MGLQLDEISEVESEVATKNASTPISANEPSDPGVKQSIGHNVDSKRNSPYVFFRDYNPLTNETNDNIDGPKSSASKKKFKRSFLKKAIDNEQLDFLNREESPINKISSKIQGQGDTNSPNSGVFTLQSSPFLSRINSGKNISKSKMLKQLRDCIYFEQPKVQQSLNVSSMATPHNLSPSARYMNKSTINTNLKNSANMSPSLLVTPLHLDSNNNKTPKASNLATNRSQNSHRFPALNTSKTTSTYT